MGPLLLKGSQPSRWGHPCGVEDRLSSIGTKVSCPYLDQVHWLVSGWTSHLCLRHLCVPCPSGCVARWSSLCPGASVVLSSLQCSSLSQLGLRIASTTLAPGLGLSLVPYPSSCRLGFVPRSVAPLCALLPLAPSFRVVFTEAAGLWGVLGSLHCAPLTVGPLPGPPALPCLLSPGCLLGLETSPSGDASASA